MKTIYYGPVYVYIASPYTKGDMARNVHHSLLVANTLIENGYTPFAPLLAHFQHMMFPQDYDTWLKLDMDWLAKCDVVLRMKKHLLTGEKLPESSGADKEVIFAGQKNIPVVESVEELLKRFPPVEDSLELCC